MIVDDLADNLFLLKTMLESEGYRIEAASNGSSALEKIAAAPPHLVLLDVMMPDMTGFDVTRRVRQDEALASLPIVLITAHDEAIFDRGEAAGANGFIRKPIDFDELLARVQFFLARSDSALVHQNT